MALWWLSEATVLDFDLARDMDEWVQPGLSQSTITICYGT